MAKTLFHITRCLARCLVLDTVSYSFINALPFLFSFLFFGLECLWGISRVFDLARRCSFSAVHKSLRGVYHVSFQQIMFTLRGVRGGNSNFVFSFYIHVTTNVSHHSSCWNFFLAIICKFISCKTRTFGFPMHSYFCTYYFTCTLVYAVHVSLRPIKPPFHSILSKFGLKWYSQIIHMPEAENPKEQI